MNDSMSNSSETISYDVVVFAINCIILPIIAITGIALNLISIYFFAEFSILPRLSTAYYKIRRVWRDWYWQGERAQQRSLPVIGGRARTPRHKRERGPITPIQIYLTALCCFDVVQLSLSGVILPLQYVEQYLRNDIIKSSRVLEALEGSINTIDADKHAIAKIFLAGRNEATISAEVLDYGLCFWIVKQFVHMLDEWRSIVRFLTYTLPVAVPVLLMVTCASVWTMVVITLQRYRAVCYPLNLKTGNNKIWTARLGVLCIVIWSVLFNITHCFKLSVVDHPEGSQTENILLDNYIKKSTTELQFCNNTCVNATGLLVPRLTTSIGLTWLSRTESFRRVNTIMFLLGTYAIPVTLIAGLNCRIISSLIRAKSLRSNLTNEQQKNSYTDTLPTTDVDHLPHQGLRARVTSVSDPDNIQYLQGRPASTSDGTSAPPVLYCTNIKNKKFSRLFGNLGNSNFSKHQTYQDVNKAQVDNSIIRTGYPTSYIHKASVVNGHHSRSVTSKPINAAVAHVPGQICSLTTNPSVLPQREAQRLAMGASATSTTEDKTQANEQRAVAMVLCIVIVFAVCHSFGVINAIAEMTDKDWWTSSEKFAWFLNDLNNLTINLNSCINPLLYIIFTRRFQLEFRKRFQQTIVDRTPRVRHSLKNLAVRTRRQHSGLLSRYRSRQRFRQAENDQNYDDNKGIECNHQEWPMRSPNQLNGHISSFDGSSGSKKSVRFKVANDQIHQIHRDLILPCNDNYNNNNNNNNHQVSENNNNFFVDNSRNTDSRNVSPRLHHGRNYNKNNDRRISFDQDVLSPMSNRTLSPKQKIMRKIAINRALKSSRKRTQPPRTKWSEKSDSNEQRCSENKKRLKFWKQRTLFKRESSEDRRNEQIGLPELPYYPLSAGARRFGAPGFRIQRRRPITFAQMTQQFPE